MLSKPKYMLPGNLSQGAPILEPDENGKYNFYFAFDGDEPVNKYNFNLYSLTSLKLAKKDIKLDFTKFKAIIDEEEKTLADCIKLIRPRENWLASLTASVDKDRKITFNSKLKLPTVDSSGKEIIFYFEEDAYSQNNFLIKDYNGLVNFNIDFIVENWGDLFVSEKIYVEDGNRIDLDTIGFLSSYKSARLNNYSDLYYQLNFKGQGKLILVKADNNRFGLRFVEDFLECTATITNEQLYLELKKELPQYKKNGKAYYCIVKEKYDRAYKKEGWYITESRDGARKSLSKKAIPVIDNNLYYLEAFQKRSSDKIEEDYGPIYYNANDDDYLTYFGIQYARDSAIDRNYNAIIFQFCPYESNDTYYKILSEKSYLTVTLTSSGLDLAIQRQVELNNMLFSKDEKGLYNFEKAYECDSYNILPGDYCWNVELFSNNKSKIVSDYQYFKAIDVKQKLSFDNNQIVVNKGKWVQNENMELEWKNDEKNEFLNNPRVLDYKIKINYGKNYENVFYKSPVFNSNNITINLPFKHFPFKSKIFYTITNTDLVEEKIEKEHFLPSIKEEKDFLNIDKIFNGVELTNNSDILKKLSIFRINKEQNRIIFIKNIELNKNEKTIIEDIGNNFLSYYYCIIDEEGNWQNSKIYNNNNSLDKWRLILTKDKKNDIIKEDRMCYYQIDKIYDFYYNLVSGSIGNNAETAISTNFTNMPSVQKGFSNYWSGSLSALMGVCDEQGEFAQTIEQEKALEKLVLDQDHDKFLLDREGNIWQVEISAPLTIANQDGLVQADKLIDLKTITINWVQVESPTQIVFGFEE